MNKSDIEDVVKAELERDATSGWGSFTGGASFAAGVDSLKAIDICLALEEAFGIEIPEAHVPPGGFNTDADCTSFFVDQVLKAMPTTITEPAE